MTNIMQNISESLSQNDDLKNQWEPTKTSEYELNWSIAYTLEIKFITIQTLIHKIKNKYNIYRLESSHYQELIELSKLINPNNPNNKKLDKLIAPLEIIYDI